MSDYKTREGLAAEVALLSKITLAIQALHFSTSPTSSIDLKECERHGQKYGEYSA